MYICSILRESKGALPAYRAIAVDHVRRDVPNCLSAYVVLQVFTLTQGQSMGNHPDHSS
jgi:hypothetical protein